MRNWKLICCHWDQASRHDDVFWDNSALFWRLDRQQVQCVGHLLFNSWFKNCLECRTYAPTGMCLCFGLGVCVSTCVYMCQYITNVSVQYLCAGSMVTRRVRPTCMAWFSQCTDESQQLQDGLLCWPHVSLTFMVTAKIWLCIYFHRAAFRPSNQHVLVGSPMVGSVYS